MTRGPITDLAVSNAVSKYGLSYSRTWNSRSAWLGWVGSYSWSIDSLDFVPTTQTTLTYTVYFPDGRTEIFTGASGGVTVNGAPGLRERFKTKSGGLCYLILPDGGKIEFKVIQTLYSDPELIPSNWYGYDFTFQAIIDPYGQRTTVSYNGDGTINKVTEPGGRYIQFFYGADTYIKSSDGREVHYTYQSQTFPPGIVHYSVLTTVYYFGNAPFGSVHGSLYLSRPERRKR